MLRALEWMGTITVADDSRREEKGELVIRWPPSRIQVLWIIAIGCFLFALAVFIFLGYYFRWKWTGFPPKRLFDWLQILVSASIPVAVGVGTFALNRSAKKRDDAAEQAQKEREENAQQAQKEREENAQQAQKEREEALAERRAQDTALQAYFDRMSLMLIERPLLSSRPGEALSVVARALTLTILERIDGERKGNVLQFLSEAGLVKGEQPVIDLTGANLLEADLAFANLQGATLNNGRLRGALLYSANLQGAHLNDSGLEKANLNNADLRGARLPGANWSKASLINTDLRSALTSADERGAQLRAHSGPWSEAWPPSEGVPTTIYDIHTDLRNARGLTQEQIEQAIGDSTTELPEGLERPKSWAN